MREWRKLRALEEAFGRPWHETAQEWAQKPISQAKIAQQWTAIVSVVVPGIRYHQTEVGDIFRRAEQRQRAGSSSSAGA